jgi:hypothetical protein
MTGKLQTKLKSHETEEHRSSSKVADHIYFEKIASKILLIDKSIFSVTIASPIGEILSIRSTPIAEAMKPSKELVDKSGSLIALVYALIKQGETPYGDCKYTVMAFGKIKVAIFPVKTKDIIIALSTAPEASIEEIYLKASKLVA